MKLAFLPLNLLYGSLCFWFNSCFLIDWDSWISLLGTSGLLHDDKTFRLFGRHLKLKHKKWNSSYFITKNNAIFVELVHAWVVSTQFVFTFWTMSTTFAKTCSETRILLNKKPGKCLFLLTYFWFLASKFIFQAILRLLIDQADPDPKDEFFISENAKKGWLWHSMFGNFKNVLL